MAKAVAQHSTRKPHSSTADFSVVKMRSLDASGSNSHASENTAFIDQLAVEEPLEIRVDFPLDAAGENRHQKSVSITMRTPGADAELAVGFLFTEGLVESTSDVISAEHCGPKLSYLGHSNVIKVILSSGSFNTDKLKSLERNFYTTSSCGVCGKASIDALKTQNRFTQNLTKDDGPNVLQHTLLGLPDRLRQAQAAFDSTGGIHASGLFTESGELISLKEDVGRHNALDKLVGEALLKGRLPLTNSVLMLSGRISFELVQKASMAGIRFIAAVGAPSSLAVDLAKETDMTLVGFLRGSTFNVYCGDWRVK